MRVEIFMSKHSDICLCEGSFCGYGDVTRTPHEELFDH